jgi:hypothetical protein
LTSRKITFNLALLLIAAPLAPLTAATSGTAFSYQGYLSAGGKAGNGTYEFQFSLYNAAGGGNLVAGPLTNSAIAVTDGLFTAMLDFGSVFTGQAFWLEIGARVAATNDFTMLSPRQPITPAPYAISASNVTGPVDGSSIKPGTITGAQLAAGAVDASIIASNSITAGQLAIGAAAANLNASDQNVVRGIDLGPGQAISNYCEPGITFAVDQPALPSALRGPTNFWWLGQHIQNFAWLGGSPRPYADPRYATVINNTNALFTALKGNPGAIAFKTDAQDLAFLTFDTSTWTLVVDGRIAGGPQNSHIGYTYLTIHFPSSQIRTVELHANQLTLEYLVFSTTNSVFLPEPTQTRVLLIGDSYCEYDSPGVWDNTTGEGFYPFWMRLLDPRLEFWQGSAGGTGFLQTNSGYFGPMRVGSGAASYQDRIDYFINYSNCSPDIVLFQCTSNDRSFATNDYQAAVSNSLSKARAAWPEAKLVIAGPDIWTDYDPTRVSLRDICRQTGNAFAAYFVDWIGVNGSAPWLYGSSVNPGNNQSYILPGDVHPNLRGARFIADNMLREFYRQGILQPPGQPIGAGWTLVRTNFSQGTVTVLNPAITVTCTIQATRLGGGDVACVNEDIRQRTNGAASFISSAANDAAPVNFLILGNGPSGSR